MEAYATVNIVINVSLRSCYLLSTSGDLFDLWAYDVASGDWSLLHGFDDTALPGDYVGPEFYHGFVVYLI